MGRLGGGGFIGYPTNHLLAVLDTPTELAAGLAALEASGFAPDEVTVLEGDSAADRLDGLGARHGFRTMLFRVIQFVVMDQLPDFRRYELAVRDGRTVLAVHAPVRERMLAARDALRGAGAHFLNFYGAATTEELGRWRGPEPPPRSRGSTARRSR